ncbi:ChaN family lipoprotein [Seohaeicola saemankumensis]|nr:ChaN family lipoprotein [Seohaeicola saemankumensis]MCA0871055.1 ChaN family lipoprotein [Seohaeicola saemankumensis]
MKKLAILFGAWLAFGAVPAGAASLTVDVVSSMSQADVVLLGEVHDNPDHHALQADAIETLKPAAIVWEMLTPETAARFDAGWLNDPDHLEQAVEWASEAWPSFDLYVPVLKAAAGGPAIYGGLVPRSKTRAAMESGIGVAFGVGASQFGLMVPLPPEERAAREADQQAAHCGAMPEEMLPVMVDIQRLRDAVLARAIVTALDETGGPVVVITGNGHARKDRGIPVYLKRVKPGVRIFSLGQSEDGVISGTFDAVLDSPAVDRPDPCLAFQDKGSE